MKIACVLVLILCLVFDSRAQRLYKQGMSHPDQVVVFDDIIKAEGHAEFEYPEYGYLSRFLVTEVKVIDHKCETSLNGTALENFYGKLQMACIGGGRDIKSSFRVYGVYKGPCYKEKEVREFESQTSQKLPKFE